MKVDLTQDEVNMLNDLVDNLIETSYKWCETEAEADKETVELKILLAKLPKQE